MQSSKMYLYDEGNYSSMKEELAGVKRAQKELERNICGHLTL